MRTDKITGRNYSEHNIPMDRCYQLVLPNVVHLTIMCEHFGHESDVWYNDCFCGDRYAVFEYSLECHCWHQVSPWYARFGNAQRKMFDRYNKYFNERQVK